jgi:ABC-2 type transport system permease protein
MLSDISIMVWKEWKEILQFQGGKRSGFMGLLVMMMVFGIFMPIQWGNLWTDTAAPLSLWVVMPLVMVGTMVADSIAGERERHTLETLLASRLPDQAILLGKISASISYAWVVTQLIIFIALIPVNIMHRVNGLLFYKLEILLSGMLLSLLVACLMSNIGVMVSLRAGTVKQAQQTLGLSTFILAYVIPMAGIYLLRYVSEEIRNQLFEPILTGDVTSIVSVALVVLALMNMILYLTAKTRFQRIRLILDK